MQYLLQAFTGIEDRLTKLEASGCLDDINLIKTPKGTGESLRVTDTNNFQLNMILGSSSFFFIGYYRLAYLESEDLFTANGFFLNLK